MSVKKYAESPKQGMQPLHSCKAFRNPMRWEPPVGLNGRFFSLVLDMCGGRLAGSLREDFGLPGGSNSLPPTHILTDWWHCLPRVSVLTPLLTARAFIRVFPSWGLMTFDSTSRLELSSVVRTDWLTSDCIWYLYVFASSEWEKRLVNGERRPAAASRCSLFATLFAIVSKGCPKKNFLISIWKKNFYSF